MHAPISIVFSLFFLPLYFFPFFFSVTPLLVTLSQRFWASYTNVFEKRRYRPPMAALCKAPAKSAGIGLSITAVCKNAGKKTLGQDDFFVVPRYTLVM